MTKGQPIKAAPQTATSSEGEPQSNLTDARPDSPITNEFRAQE